MIIIAMIIITATKISASSTRPARPWKSVNLGENKIVTLGKHILFFFTLWNVVILRELSMLENKSDLALPPCVELCGLERLSNKIAKHLKSPDASQPADRLQLAKWYLCDI